MMRIFGPAQGVPRGVEVIDILNPPPSTRVMVVHPDGRVEGGPPSNVLTPFHQKIFCSAAERRPKFETEAQSRLKKIHLTGVRQGRAILSQFREWDELDDLERVSLFKLWQEHDQHVAFLNGNWADHPEYLDPIRPFHFDLELAHTADIPLSVRRKIVSLHHAIRSSLAEEESLRFAFTKDNVKEIRYRIARKGLPIRKGVVSVHLDWIDRVLAVFEEKRGGLDSGERRRIRETLLKMEAVRGFQELAGWKRLLNRAQILERLCPGLDRIRRQKVLFLHHLLHYPKVSRSLKVEAPMNGSAWSGLPFGKSMREFRLTNGLGLEEAALKLGVPAETLKSIERGRRRQPGGRPFVPDRWFLRALIDPQRYGLPAASVYRLHLETFWKGDKVVDLLRKRTFRRPVFIDSKSYLRVKEYANYPFRTPGEVLYYWRNSEIAKLAWILNSFPPTEDEVSAQLGISPFLYESWERNQVVPTKEEEERLIARFKRSQDRELFSRACELMRGEIVRRSDLAGARRKFRKFPGVIRFLELLPLRRFFSTAAQKRLAQKLLSLNRHDPESIAFIDRIASAIEDPLSDAMRRLLVAVRESEERARNWPPKIRRQGPIAAVYYYHKGRGGELVRFGRALHSSRTRLILISGQDGRFDWVRGFDPMTTKVESRENQGLFLNLVRFLKKEASLFTKKGLSRLAGKIRFLEVMDQTSYGDFIDLLRRKQKPDGSWEREEWHRIRVALESTVHFVRRYKGKIRWKGSAFLYYYENRDDKEKRKILHNRLAYGYVKKVSFAGGEALFSATSYLGLRHKRQNRSERNFL
jgi:transcriptional regulator with XRE-family HTH domain